MSIEIIISLIAALGVGGILGAILNRRYEQQKQTNEHDIKIFTQSDEILSEKKILDIADFQLLTDHSIIYEDLSLLKRWYIFFSHAGNQYLNKKINNERRKLTNDLALLEDFITINFSEKRLQNPNSNRKYLKPDWNIDRGFDSSLEKAAKYQEYAQEMCDLTEKVVKQYARYRLEIKRTLKI